MEETLTSTDASTIGSPPGLAAYAISADGSLLFDVPLHTRGLIFGPGAPGGLSMTSGFRFAFCR